ncbi:RHS repeat-associated core domain-containing protein [Actinoalloteichus fjordicus]|uniref:RHS repeat-associated core domain n=1 Tax=Actinoalloteichus fjordicus TaxID=1612552 RepID=A0AAC9PU95_9PSEU|nr:RHS repeat-associated core domain-containing protein [Actinoalloteichus fjordicus]APU16973.1 RHS repeat-associated core domain [Actinoalloteichus fjordicus]
MSNPLVADVVDSTTSTSGLSLVESVNSTNTAIQNGDWLEAGLGTADLVMSALDPFAAIISNGVGWLIEHVGPLSDALDALAGNPDEIRSHADTWSNVAGEVNSVATELGNLIKTDVSTWTGAAADAYRTRAADTANLILAAGAAAGGAADGIQKAGEVVSAVRDAVRDIIADVVGSLVSWALQVLFTLGIGLIWVVPKVVAKVAQTAATIAQLTTKLVASMCRLAPLLRKLGDDFACAGKDLKRIRTGENHDARSSGHAPEIGTSSSRDSGERSHPVKAEPSAGSSAARSDGAGDGTRGLAGDALPSTTGRPGAPALQTEGNRPQNPFATGTDADNRNCVTDPVDVGTGEVLLTELDLELPDPFPLLLMRTHVSGYRAGRRFGSNWAATVDQRLEVDDEGVCFLSEDGMILVYPHPRGDAPSDPVAGPRHPLSRRQDGSYTVEMAGRTLWFGTRSPGAPGVVELDAVTGSSGSRIDVERRAQALVLTHSAGYRVTLHITHDRVTELHVLGRENTAEPADVLVLRYGYDDRGRLAELINSSGLATRFDYDDAGRLTGWRDRTGTRYRYEYDIEGRCVRTVGPDGRLSSAFSYDADRRTTAFTDSLGAVTVYQLNERYQTVRQTDPLGHTTVSTWDSRHRLLARTDPLGHTTRFEYRSDGSPSVVVRPDGSRVAVRCGAELDIEVVQDGRVWRRSYAGADRPDPFLTPLGVSTAIGLPAGTPGPAAVGGGAGAGGAAPVPRDMFGRPTMVPDPAGTLAQAGWTVEGRLGWRAASAGREQWRYDPEGNEVEYRDSAGHTRRRSYGPFGLLVAEIDPTGARTEYVHDTESRLIAVTNALGQTWHYAYDPVGRLIESVDFDGRPSRFDYDPAGRLVRTVVATGEAVEYRYDVLGNVVEQHTAAGITTFGYDPVGELVFATAPGTELTITRDERGRVTSQTVNGRTVAFDYDETARVVRRRTPSGIQCRTRYAEDGEPVALDVDGHPVNFRVLAAGTVRPGTGHQLDANGRITEVTSPDDVERYRYDALGNLTTSPLAGLHRYAGTTLVQAGATGYRHDALGRLVHRIQRLPAGMREWHYVWGPQDRLLGVATPDGTRWRYHYDPLGRRIAKQRLDSSGAVAELVEFVWDGPVLIEEIRTDSTGSRTTTWAHGPTDDRPLAQVETSAQAGVRRFFTIHTDRVGTPVELRDTGGATAWRAHHTLWGAPLANAPRFPAHTPLRFPGQYHDPESGLNYNVFRYYDPVTARYISQDPLGLAPSVNPVAYVPNPLVAADPLGLTCSSPTTSRSPTPATPGAGIAPQLVTSSGSRGVSKSRFNHPDHAISAPDLDQAAKDYLNSSDKKRASEAMGEQGALTYLRERTGQKIDGLHTATAATPHDLPTNPGQAWSHAVRFDKGGSGVTDVAHWDGRTLHVIEAKGGTSALNTREQAFFHKDITGEDAHRFLTESQAAKPAWQRMSSSSEIDAVKNQDYTAGDPIPAVFKDRNTGAAPNLMQGGSGYLTDVAHAMKNSSLTDGRNLLGEQILQHQNSRTIDYVPVRTQVSDGGSPTVTAG